MNGPRRSSDDASLNPLVAAWAIVVVVGLTLLTVQALNSSFSAPDASVSSWVAPRLHLEAHPDRNEVWVAGVEGEVALDWGELEIVGCKGVPRGEVAVGDRLRWCRGNVTVTHSEHGVIGAASVP